MKVSRILMTVLAGAAVAAAGCGDNDACEPNGEISVCGDFGEVVYTSQLNGGWERVAWPPIAQADGTLLVTRGSSMLRLDRSGNVSVQETFNGTASPPSMAPNGDIFVVAGDGDPRVASVGGGSSVSYSGSSAGEAPGAPVTVGPGTLYAGTTSGWERAPTQLKLDRQTLTVLDTRPGASPAVIVSDDSTRHLEGSDACDDPYDDLVAETPTGVELWRYAEGSGIRDFAPGPGDEVYLVTGNNTLVRVGADGGVDWTFDPGCTDCNVAAAPTVTADAIYFPVWEGRGTPNGCDDPEVVIEDAVDPLYALRHDGSEIWVYDGFDTKNSVFNATGMLPGNGAPGTVTTEEIRHHPSGRPGVAQDGTLYAATDGAVVALNSRGEEVGRALYDANVGEVINGSDDLGTIRPGVRPAPVLGPDGTLYVWDGDNVRAFRTGKPAADIPWSAPFGGFTNDGRVGN